MDLGVASPFADSHLAAVTWAHLTDQDNPVMPVTRAQAMAIPPLAKGRNLICGQAMRVNLMVDHAAGGDAPDARFGRVWAQPEPWRARPLTLAWVVDSLIWYGRAWLIVRDRYAPSEGSWPRAYEWVPETDVAADPNRRGHLMVRGEPVSADDVVMIPGHHDGLLRSAQSALRDARDLYRAAGRAAKNPVPSIELHQTTPTPLAENDRKRLVADWAAAREGANGGVAYTNHAIEVKTHGQAAEQLLLGGRKATNLEMAQLLGLTASDVDAEVGGSSLTYRNLSEADQRRLNDVILPYLLAITGRLSLPDVLPAGYSMRAATRSMVSPDFKSRMEGYQAAIAAGVYTVEQCQELEAGHEVKIGETTR